MPLTRTDLASLDLAALAAAYADGLEPVDVVNLVYDRIEAAGDPGIFLALVPREALIETARALARWEPSERGPLWGVPFAVKDNIDVVGLPTTCACPAFSRWPRESAPAVAALVASGAIVIGKTNLDQFATGLVGVRTPYAIPRNAFDPQIIPGGSSSGSAVAVARGLVAFALGTDTAGSGRVPAGLGNIVGLKPSRGLISNRGVVPAVRSIDCVSIFALTAEDAWDVLRVAAGYDRADPLSRPIPLGMPAMPPAVRLGVPDAASLRFHGDARAEAAWRAANERLRSMGATLVPMDFSAFFAAADLLYEGPWLAERRAGIRAFLAENEATLHPVTRTILDKGTRFDATDAFDGQYRLAELQRAVQPTLAGLDGLAVPTAPIAPSLAEMEADPYGPNQRLGTYTNFVNLLDLAAIAVPGPFRPDDLPAGVTFIGRAGRDALLAAIGRAFHQAGGGRLGATMAPLPPPRAFRASAADEMIEIVVIGAHLSGMPLNVELARAGGVFYREVETLPRYRLYALAGGPPKRPGLLRVPEAQGAAIATEVWGLSPDAFGRFVASVPSPLSIGTVQLADGTSPKGFLVEAEAVRGAEDITGFGGWRAFMARAA